MIFSDICIDSKLLGIYEIQLLKWLFTIALQFKISSTYSVVARLLVKE